VIKSFGGIIYLAIMTSAAPASDKETD